MNSYITGLCGMSTQKRKKALKGCYRAEIRLDISLCLENISVFSVSADPERILTNLGY